MPNDALRTAAQAVVEMLDRRITVGHHEAEWLRAALAAPDPRDAEIAAARQDLGLTRMAYESEKRLRDAAHAALTERDAEADLRHDADARAVKRWQEATGRVEVLPDHADLCVWLLGERERLRAALGDVLHAIDEAGRQGAIGTMSPENMRPIRAARTLFNALATPAHDKETT